MPSLAANLDQTLRDLLVLLGPLLHTSCLRRSAASLRMRRSGRAPAAGQRTCRALPRRLANRDGATGQECADTSSLPTGPLEARCAARVRDAARPRLVGRRWRARLLRRGAALHRWRGVWDGGRAACSYDARPDGVGDYALHSSASPCAASDCGSSGVGPRLVRAHRTHRVPPSGPKRASHVSTC